MKKMILMSLMVFESILVLNAQTTLKNDRFHLNAGMGAVIVNYGRPSVFVGFDYMLTPALSLGAEYTFLSYYSHMRETQYGYMLNMNYHFNKLLKLHPRWDIYAGPILEYEQRFNDWDNSNLTHNRWVLGLQVGAKYYINDRVALNLKTGAGNAMSVGTLGISVGF
jgi:outer membrane immunogenic protein